MGHVDTTETLKLLNTLSSRDAREKLTMVLGKDKAERLKLVRFLNTAAAVPCLYNVDALAAQPDIHPLGGQKRHRATPSADWHPGHSPSASTTVRSIRNPASAAVVFNSPRTSTSVSATVPQARQIMKAGAWVPPG
jgi:hypothetical protein